MCNLQWKNCEEAVLLPIQKSSKVILMTVKCVPIGWRLMTSEVTVL